MKKKIIVPHLYIKVYDGIQRNSKTHYLTPKELFGLIRITARIKDSDCREVIKEFEKYELLQRLSHQSYVLLESKYIENFKKKKGFMFW